MTRRSELIVKITLYYCYRFCCTLVTDFAVLLLLFMLHSGDHFCCISRFRLHEDPEEMEGFPQRDSFQYTLGDLLKFPGDTFTFIYDPGDCWKHIVSLVDIHPNMYEDTDGDYASAHLIAGQGACPPEDVGGVYGYADMLKALANHDEDEDDDERGEYLNWMGREFDPEFFDLHELLNRADDFQRVIGEARWGFYRR